MTTPQVLSDKSKKRIISADEIMDEETPVPRLIKDLIVKEGVRAPDFKTLADHYGNDVLLIITAITHCTIHKIDKDSPFPHNINIRGLDIERDARTHRPTSITVNNVSVASDLVRMLRLYGVLREYPGRNMFVRHEDEVIVFSSGIMRDGEFVVGNYFAQHLPVESYSSRLLTCLTAWIPLVKTDDFGFVKQWSYTATQALGACRKKAGSNPEWFEKFIVLLSAVLRGELQMSGEQLANIPIAATSLLSLVQAHAMREASLLQILHQSRTLDPTQRRYFLEHTRKLLLPYPLTAATQGLASGRDKGLYATGKLSEVGVDSCQFILMTDRPATANNLRQFTESAEVKIFYSKEISEVWKRPKNKGGQAVKLTSGFVWWERAKYDAMIEALEYGAPIVHPVVTVASVEGNVAGVGAGEFDDF